MSILSQKWFFDNILTATSQIKNVTDEDVFYPATNIVMNQTVKEYRSNALTSPGDISESFVIDGLTAKEANSFLVCGNVATGSLSVDSITIEGNPTNEWSSPGFTITLTDIDEEEFFGYKDFGSTETFQFWRITLNKTAAAVGDYVSISNLFIGKDLGLDTTGLEFGWTFEQADKSQVQEGRYGQRYVDVINNQKKIKGSYTLLNVEERELLYEMFAVCGINKPVWFIVDSSESITHNKDLEAGLFWFDYRPTFKNDSYKMYSTDFSLSQVV